MANIHMKPFFSLQWGAAQKSAAGMILCCGIAACFFFLVRGHVLINGHLVAVEKARTPAQWEKGLSGQSRPNKEGGMLFLFHPPQRPVFWMKGMKFSLDVVWLRDGVVVETLEHLSPPEAGRPAEEFSPGALVDAVWELPAGAVAKLGIKPGDNVTGAY